MKGRGRSGPNGIKKPRRMRGTSPKKVNLQSVSEFKQGKEVIYMGGSSNGPAQGTGTQVKGYRVGWLH